LAAALLEGDDLRSALVVEHFRRDRGAGHRGRAQHRRVTADHQNFAKLHDRADVTADLAYLEYIIRNDAVLPAAGFDDCEHRLIPSCSIPSSRLRPGRLLVQSVMGTCSARTGANPLRFRAKTSGAGNPAPDGGLYSGLKPRVK